MGMIYKHCQGFNLQNDSLNFTKWGNMEIIYSGYKKTMK